MTNHIYLDVFSDMITKMRLVLVFFCLIFIARLEAQLLQPRSASVLSKGNWYKIAIPKSGVYKVDFDFLTKELKIAESELEFSKLGLFGYGGGVLPEYNLSYTQGLPENNIEIFDANNNGKLESADYFLFYGAGPIRWQFDPSTNRYRHTSAYYSDLQHFFISTTEGTGKRVQNIPSASNPVKTLNTYDYYGVLDIDSINPDLSGRMWYSHYITNFNKSFETNLPIESCTSGESAIITVGYFSKLNGVPMTITVNGSYVKTINLTESSTTQMDTFKIFCPGPNAKIKFEINQTITNNVYLDYITSNVKNNLTYANSQYNFRFKDGIGTSDILQFNISNMGGAKVWEVSKPDNINAPALSGSGTNKSYVFSNNIPKEFVVFELTNAYTPSAVGKITNQNLSDLSSADNIIIAHKTWLSVAKDLASFHNSETGTQSHVVDVEEIYNEYSSGNKDVTAIRRFVSEQYDKSPPTKRLSTLTLFGKACLDYKGINKISNVCVDYIPTYETLHSTDYLHSFCTDDYFGLDASADTNLDDAVKSMMIGVGRLPVSSLDEAKQVVAKIKQYKAKESYGDWRNITTNVSDDYDDVSDASFYIQNESIITKYIQDNKIKTNQNKIYLDAFAQEQFSGGQRYEDAEKLLKDNFTFGSILISYIGHGGSANWAQERILSTSDLPIYKNLNSLPFLTTATCGFAPYDKPNASNKSAGERYLLQKDGGAIGLLTTCREVLISDQGPFMDNFIKSFYNRKSNGRFNTFGDISRLTKNFNRVDLNSQKVVLLGDPALEINIPQYNIVTTSVTNGTDDTLKSLSKIVLKGEVQDLSNTMMSDFNGFCQITVFDKKSLNKLNYNDTKDPLIPKDTFETQTSRIFKGSTNVINGRFSIEFIVPKDINYGMGRGRISYYAADVNQKPYRDASGMDTTIFVGGANLNAPSDEDAPVVKLYMNDEKFAFGGITNADPSLLVKISDRSGINTTGAGVGHDITAILDGDIRLPINLNNYYKTEVGDFTQGRITYPFYQLNEGKHTIKVKAWDVYNNPGEGYTEFIVAKSQGIALRHVLNYPNPFTTHTRFEFEHNRPNQLLDVSINIMTITGKVVKKIYKKIMTDGFRVNDQFPWDGKDDYGESIGRGVYVYMITIRDSKGESTYQYEKLVLLQ